jgi:hypothetical protein
MSLDFVGGRAGDDAKAALYAGQCRFNIEVFLNSVLI